MKKLLIVVLFLNTIVSDAFSQKQKTELNQLWIGNNNQIRFSKKWGASADIQLRSKRIVSDSLFQLMLRVAGVYYVNNATRISVGYAFEDNYPGDNHKYISLPVHAPFQQITWVKNLSNISLVQNVRLEERFRHNIKNDYQLAPGYNFNYRLRYNVTLNKALSKQAFKPNTFALTAYDELYVNFGKQIVYNTFDQNRLFLGLSYFVNKSSNLQFGYLNVFQQLSAGNRYRVIHAPRIFYICNINLYKKGNSKPKPESQIPIIHDN